MITIICTAIDFCTVKFDNACEYIYCCLPICISVPELVCSDPVSADGIITVQWSFIHTGGLNLTGLSAVYSFTDGTLTVTESFAIPSLDATSVNVSNLVAGFVYTFAITAENSNGSSTVSCKPTPHQNGEFKY